MSLVKDNNLQAIVNGFQAQATMYAQALDGETLARFLKQRQEGKPIISGEAYKRGQSLAEVISDSCNLSDMPLSVYLKAEKEAVTKIGESCENPIYWLGSLGLFVMAGEDANTWEINLSWPAYPPGW